VIRVRRHRARSASAPTAAAAAPPRALVTRIRTVVSALTSVEVALIIDI